MTNTTRGTSKDTKRTKNIHNRCASRIVIDRYMALCYFLIFLPCFISSSYSSSNECYTNSCGPDNALCIDGIYLYSLDDDTKECPDHNQSKDDIIFFIELDKRKQSSHYNHKNCPENICHSSHSSSDMDKSCTYICYDSDTDSS